MKKLLCIFLFVQFTTNLPAQKMFASGTEIRFTGNNKELKLNFCTPSMFRVRTTWNKSFEADENWMVVKYNWTPTPVISKEQKDFFELSTNELLIKVDKAS